MGMMDRARAAVRAWQAPASIVSVDAGDAGFSSVSIATGAELVAGPDGMSDTGGFTVLNLLGGGRSGHAPMSEARALTVPAVLRALEVLCGLFAMTPCHYYRRTPEGKVRIDDAPQAQMMLTSANAVQPAFLLKELMMGDLLMRGRFGAYIHRDQLYRARALSRLLPDGLQPYQHWDEADGLELFYDAQLPNGARKRLTRNECWYVPGFSRDGLVGVNRLQLLADSFEAAASTNEFAARFWDNNAQPSTVLTTAKKVEAPEKLKIRTEWAQRFSGPRNAGAVAVLDQEMKAEFLSHNNKDAQYIETRTFAVVEVARAFGVPPHVLFELSRATFTNIEHQSLELYLHSMLTHFERAAAHLNHQFADAGCFFEFLPEAMLKGDLKSRYEAYAIAIDKGILNPDEVRDMENRNKRPDGDKYRVGSGSTIEGQQPAPAADRAPPAPAPSEDDE